MDAFLRNPIISGVLIILVAAVIVYLVRFHLRTGKTLDRLDTFVLPHFMPPDPGDPDYSLPGQVRELKQETAKVRGELRDHMANEEEQRINDANQVATDRKLLRRVARAVDVDPDA